MRKLNKRPTGPDGAPINSHAFEASRNSRVHCVCGLDYSHPVHEPTKPRDQTHSTLGKPLVALDYERPGKPSIVAGKRKAPKKAPANYRVARGSWKECAHTETEAALAIALMGFDVRNIETGEIATLDELLAQVVRERANAKN